jgi:hypothetical protein
MGCDLQRFQARRAPAPVRTNREDNAMKSIFSAALLSLFPATGGGVPISDAVDDPGARLRDQLDADSPN